MCRLLRDNDIYCPYFCAVLKASIADIDEQTNLLLVVLKTDRLTNRQNHCLPSKSFAASSTPSKYFEPQVDLLSSRPYSYTLFSVRSRLSLVEERLSLITHEINTIHKSDTCSEVSSQTGYILYHLVGGGGGTYKK